MIMPPQLSWLPEARNWTAKLAPLGSLAPAEQWNTLISLANQRIDFVQTGRLDRALQRLFGDSPPFPLHTKPLKLAILATSTVSHLVPGIRVGALRRGLWLKVYEGPYGQQWQELADTSSGLHRFAPDVVLLAFDAIHLVGAEGSTVESALELMCALWRRLRDCLGCTVIQQAVIPVFPLNFGATMSIS